MRPQRNTFTILMYHSSEDDPYMRRFCVPPHRFVWHMEWLRVNEYHVGSLLETANLIRPGARLVRASFDCVSLRAGTKALTGNWPASPHPTGLTLTTHEAAAHLPRHARQNGNSARRSNIVALSFDDGFEDFAVVACPVLKHYQFPATMFVASRRVGQTNEWDRPQTKVVRPLLGWQDLQSQAQDGVEIGSHGETHQPLTALPAEQVFHELFESASRSRSTPARALVCSPIRSVTSTRASPASPVNQAIPGPSLLPAGRTALAKTHSG